MQDELVYALTPAGEVELRGRATTLAPAELDLLVRIDGVLTLRQIMAAMPSADPIAGQHLMGRLSSLGLIAPVELDPIDLQFRTALDSRAAARGDAQAEAGLASLRRAGYYVSIARPRARVRERPAGGPLTAVVVEDDPGLATFVSTYLSFEGWAVRVAGNRAEATAQLRKLPVADLVLLDVVLPDIDGFLILERMRQHAVLRDIPVIMLTGKANRESVLKGMACGADGYVTKPCEADALMRAVRQVLGLDDTSPPAPDEPWSGVAPR